VDDIVRMGRIVRKQRSGSGHRRERTGGGHVIQTQQVADAPRDVVIRAGRIAARPHRADDDVPGGIESQPAAKYVHAADLQAIHRICRGAVGDARIHGIAGLKAEQAAAGLDGGVQVRG